MNAKKGRGGLSAATKKFGVSPLSLSNWIKKGGGSATGGKKGGAKAAGSGPGRRRTGGRDNALKELVALNREISRTRAQLDAAEAKFQKLKGAL